MTKSVELLNEIVLLWGQSKIKYRDEMIKIGILLHEYVFARLTEADSMSADRRGELRATRVAAVADAADHLQCRPAKINELIRVAMGVSLLSDNGNIGELSYTALRTIHPLVERIRIPRHKDKRHKGELREGEHLPSDREKWIIRPGLEQQAKSIFRTAVKENWTSLLLHTKIRSLLYDEKSRYTPCMTRSSGSQPVNLLMLAKIAPMKDVASMIIDIIKQTKDPQSVLAIVNNELASASSMLRYRSLIHCE